jgi:hypothetical protein
MNQRGLGESYAREGRMCGSGAVSRACDSSTGLPPSSFTIGARGWRFVRRPSCLHVIVTDLQPSIIPP